MKKTFAALFSALPVLLAMALFLTDPARYAQSVSEGVSLWAACVLPATFPFLFLTALLTGLPAFSAFSKLLSRPMGKLFRISGAGGGAALLSALSGYPVGARTVLDLRSAGRLSPRETFKTACLATTSGPMFLVGTVGSLMFHSAALGWVLFFSHLAAVWAGSLPIPSKRSGTPPPPLKQNPALLYDALYGAVISILCVGGSIALFSCFGQMLGDLGAVSLLAPLFGEYAEGIARGLLEMTAGCKALSALQTPLSAALCCALVTFGGVCVLCQQAVYLTRAGVKMLPFLGVKLLQAALAFGICFGVSSLVL